MVKKIEYENKVAIQNDDSIAEKNKVTDANMNEIKETVNNNADELVQAQEDIVEIKQEQTTQNTNIQELQAENTELKAENERLRADNVALAIIGQENGENITLNDASDARFTKFEIGGNHKQETREGYNIVDISKFTDTTREGVAITRDIEKGCLTLNGTSTSTFAISIPFILESGKVISYSLNNSQINSEVAIRFGTANSTIGYLACGSVNTKKENLTLTENITDLQIRIGTGITLTNFVIYPQVEKSDSLHEFELYGAMPSFEFKSEVETIKDKADFVVCNKNIFSINNSLNRLGAGTNISYISEKSLEISGSGAWTYYQLIFGNYFKNTDFAISANFLEKAITHVGGISVYGTENLNGDSPIRISSLAVSELTINKILKIITTFNSGNYKYILFRFWANGTNTALSSACDTVISDIQLERGTEATEVVEHQEQAFTIDIQKEFCKIGDYKDTFIKQSGQWYEKHIIEKIIFTGNENWQKSGTYSGVYYLKHDYISNKPIPNTYVLCNRGKSIIYDGTNYAVGTVVNDSNSFGLRLTDGSEISTLALWTSYLKEEYDAGTPIYFCYLLATPKLIPCTEAQSKVLDEIEKTIHSYKGTTHIFSTNELSPIFDTEYAKDTQSYIDNQINKLTTAVVELGGNINV